MYILHTTSINSLKNSQFKLPSHQPTTSWALDQVPRRCVFGRLAGRLISHLWLVNLPPPNVPLAEIAGPMIRAYENYWFPLIRPDKTVISDGYVRGVRLISHKPVATKLMLLGAQKNPCLFWFSHRAWNQLVVGDFRVSKSWSCETK